MGLAFKKDLGTHRYTGTLSASCAFMLPVATPPNAIVYGAGRFKIAVMSRAGLVLNFAGVLIISLGFYFVGRIILGVDLGAAPGWAGGAGAL